MLKVNCIMLKVYCNSGTLSKFESVELTEEYFH